MRKIAGYIGVIVLATLASGCSKTPETDAAKRRVAALKDRQNAARTSQAFAVRIPCATAAQKPFDSETGKELVWTLARADGWIQCYSSEGFDSVTGKKLLEITEDQVIKIRTHPEIYRPESAEAVEIPMCPSVDCPAPTTAPQWGPEQTLTPIPPRR